MGLIPFVRQDAAGNMAGAIFRCNISTKDRCIQAGVFGLPKEYESFVSNVKQGMPLFLFEHDLRKLYGVFEATSDGGLNIKTDGIHRAFPAQVRIRVVWNCRPLSEDEFSPAIRENYYQPGKFYIDLSHEQIARLYHLFGVQNHMEYRSLGTQDCSKRAPDTDGGSSDDQLHFMFPQTQALANRYSSHTSRHTVSTPGVEVLPNMMMPFGMESFGAQIPFMHNQFAGSFSYPQYLYVTPNPIYGAVSTISTPCTFPIPALSLENPQGNVDYQECTSSASEQVTNSTSSHFEPNSGLDLEAEAGESTEPEPPFMDFKRRSEARNVDKILGNEISGKGKRRLVRPSFEENNASACPSVLNKIQTKKLGETDANKTKGSDVMYTVNEQVPPFNNGVPELETIDVSFDMDISGLVNMTQESKLQAIIGKILQTLSLASPVPTE